MDKKKILGGVLIFILFLVIINYLNKPSSTTTTSTTKIVTTNPNQNQNQNIYYRSQPNINVVHSNYNPYKNQYYN